MSQPDSSASIPDCEFTGHNLTIDNLCPSCGRTYVAVDALTSIQALIAASEVHRQVRSQIEYLGASDYDGPSPSEAAVRAAIATASSRNEVSS